MSMKSEIEKKVATARLAGYGFFGLFVVGLFVPKEGLPQGLGQLLAWVPFIGVAGSHWYIGATAALCPRCKAKLPQARYGLGLDKNLRQCPSCQLNLNLDSVPAAQEVK